jgi:hypothetical protein
MELIEIIKSSLSIFSMTAFIFIIISYTIYKIKDRSRIKPYLGVNVNTTLGRIIAEKRGVEFNVNMEGKPEEVNQFDRFLLDKLPVQNRFTIINGNVSVNKFNSRDNRIENPECR